MAGGAVVEVTMTQKPDKDGVTVIDPAPSGVGIRALLTTAPVTAGTAYPSTDPAGQESTQGVSWATIVNPLLSRFPQLAENVAAIVLRPGP